MPKIAICLAGHMRNWERCVHSFNTLVADRLNADVFVLTYSERGSTDPLRCVDDQDWDAEIVDVDKIKKAYKTTSVKVLPKRDISNFIKYDEIELGLLSKSKFRLTPHRTMSLLSIIKESFEFVDGDYDIIIRCRPDLKFSETPNIIMDDKIHVLPLIIHNSGGFSYISDMFAYGRYHLMKKYCETFDYVDECIQQNIPFAGEMMISGHINKYNIPVVECNACAVLTRHGQDMKYSKMQKKIYDKLATHWSPSNRDEVVGSFDAHNSWEDYELLFKNISNSKELVALDFGTGPGRNIVHYQDRFSRIDGVDISPIVLEKAKVWTELNGITDSNLILCNGYDLENIQDEFYDVVFSTICLQHIAVHEIRLSYFKEFSRVLKPNGYLSFQLGYGGRSNNVVRWHDNAYDAESTNGAMDVALIDFNTELLPDLVEAGFNHIEYDISKVGPGDSHKEWIYVRARKS